MASSRKLKTQKVIVKPSYETLEKAYKETIKDLAIFWNKYKPNETFITKQFLYNYYLKGIKNDKN